MHLFNRLEELVAHQITCHGHRVERRAHLVRDEPHELSFGLQHRLLLRVLSHHEVIVQHKDQRDKHDQPHRSEADDPAEVRPKGGHVDFGRVESDGVFAPRVPMGRGVKHAFYGID